MNSTFIHNSIEKIIGPVNGLFLFHNEKKKETKFDFLNNYFDDLVNRGKNENIIRINIKK